MGKSPIVKKKVQQIWAYVLHIRQKKRSNGRMLEIMSINQCFPKNKKTVTCLSGNDRMGNYVKKTKENEKQNSGCPASFLSPAYYR